MIKIKKAEYSDAQLIYECNKLSLGYDYSLENTVSRVKYIMDKYPDDLFLIAELNGEKAGYIHARSHECTYMDSFKRVEELAVLPDFKGKGIGKKLLQAVEEWAQANHAEGISLESGFARIEAHQFYLKAGYVHRKNHKNFVKYFKS